MPAIETSRRILTASWRRARDRVLGWQPPLPEMASYETILQSEPLDDGSISIGKTHDGRLEHAARLPPEGDHYAIIESHRDRETHYGTDEMIQMIRDVAAEVAEAHSGSILKVGNISRRHGGHIRWSHSHHTGRDVDFAFYCRRHESGQRVPAPRLVAFNREGRSIEPHGFRFDTPRNWRLVASLLTHADVDIQRIFISYPLERRLLKYARSRDVDEDLVERAREVMLQPSGASAHNDHFHVRITCSRRDRLEGCLNYGPRWDWANWHQRDLLAHARSLRRALEVGDVETRLAALAELERIESPYGPEIALLEGFEDPREDVRARALDVARYVAWWSATAIQGAIRWLESSRATFEHKEILYAILRRARDPLGHRWAFSTLLDEATPPRERRLAARALSHAIMPGMVPVWIDELSHQPGDVREAIVVILRRNTGHSEKIDWSEASPEKRRRATASWHRWWRRHQSEPRRHWLLESLKQQGFELPELQTVSAIPDLIEALKGTPDHVAYIANRQLHRITGEWIPLEGWSARKLHRHWSSWWETHRERVRAEHSDEP